MYKDLIQRLEKLQQQLSALVESQSFIKPVYDMYYALLLEVRVLLSCMKCAIFLELVQYKDAMLVLMNTRVLLSTLSVLLNSKWEKLKRLKRKETVQTQNTIQSISNPPTDSRETNTPFGANKDPPILLRLLTEYYHFLFGKASLFFYCPLASTSSIIHQNVNVAMKKLRYDFVSEIERLSSQFGLSNILCIFDGSEFPYLHRNLKDITTLSFPSIHGYKCPEPTNSSIFPSGLASYSVFFAYPSTNPDTLSQQFWNTISLITELQRNPTRGNCKFEIYDRTSPIAQILISPPITQIASEEYKLLTNAHASTLKHRKSSSGDAKTTSSITSVTTSASSTDRIRTGVMKERLVRFVVGRVTEYVFLQITVP
jgi:hypothetical protein